MKILSMKLGGIGVFSEPTEVPIKELGDAALVAIVGENGSGKTTLVESVPGCIYRKMPSRGAVAGLANSRDSHIEHTVDLGGREITSRLLINGTAKTPTSEAYLSEGGEPMTSGKVSDYATKVAELFPSSDVFMSSAFAAQGGEGSFLSLPVAERKQLFAKLLGLGRLQEMSDTAGANSRTADSKLTATRARRDTMRERCGDIGRLNLALNTAHAEVVNAGERLQAAKDNTQELRNAMLAWSELATANTAAESEASANLASTKNAASAVQQDLARHRSDIAKASGVHAALTNRLSKRDQVAAIAGTLASKEALVTDVETQLADARTLMDAHATLLRQRDNAIIMHKAAVSLREVAEQTRRQNEWVRREQLVAKHTIAKQALDNAGRASKALGTVPCDGDGEFATCALIKTAVDARDSITRLEQAESDAADAVPPETPPVGHVDLQDDNIREKIRAERELLEAIPPEPVRVDPPGGLVQQLAELRADVREATAAAATLTELDKLTGDLDRVSTEIKETKEKVAQCETLAEQKGALVLASERALEKATEVCALHNKAKPTEVDSGALLFAQQQHSTAISHAEQLARDVAQASEDQVTIEDLEATITAKTADLDDWKHLQRALGPQGIQALEIDAAGPEVSDLANDLLHACYGHRFTVSLVTTTLKADGKGTKEVFDLLVIDTLRGTEGSAGQLSGGEQVLIGEALALAIAVYNTRRSSIPMLDLFRDECAGALSQDNAVRYIEMLRKAIALGGFHRCYFIAHQQELWELADSRLLVEHGTVRVAGSSDIEVQGSPATA